MSESETVDVLVIGGGINGAGIARDFTGRGLSVVLAEQGDLGHATSSASTKLIHGGLRYLEYYEFRLVREALKEREVLLRAAPHIISPLRFVLPYNKSLRPAWFIRLGLFLYDHLGGREILPGSHGIRFSGHPAGAPLAPGFDKGFVYSDCWVDDARLVVLNARDAADRGAEILTRTRVAAAQPMEDHWRVTLSPAHDDQGPGQCTDRVVRARTLVNASGPWVARVLEDTLGLEHGQRIRMVKGSHIVVPRMFGHDYAYIFQNPDKRIIFAIPYQGEYTLIGTTDEDYHGDPGNPVISESETAYLCRAVSKYFAKPVTPKDVVWSYSGVRPLYDDNSKEASSVTRDYVLILNGDGRRKMEPPVLSIFGGKITTYRRLAEQAFDKLAPAMGRATNREGTAWTAGAWTASVPLPGGDIENADFDRFLKDLKGRHPWLPAELAHRYARAYGTRVEALLGSAGDLSGLGEDMGGGLFEAEVRYLVNYEWAMTAEDILWRRSKLGLHASAETVAALEAWLNGNPGGAELPPPREPAGEEVAAP